MINRLPWHKKLRTSAANNLDKINEIIDYINHSNITEFTLSESGSGEVVQAGKASSLKDLTVYGEAVQDGTPTPDAPVNVQVVEGRNLLDPQTSEEATASKISFGLTCEYEGDGIFHLYGTATNTSANVLRVFGATDSSVIIDRQGTYTLSVAVDGTPLSSNLRVQILYAEDSYSLNSNNETKTITTDYVNNIRFYLASGLNGQTVDMRVKFQLELGSIATPYVPYGSIGLQIGETITPIDLQGNVLASLPDGTKDELKINSAGHVTIEKRVKKSIFNGSENWVSITAGGRVALPIADILKNADAISKIGILCDYFVEKTMNESYSQIGVSSNDAAQQIVFRPSTENTSAADWKTWLQTHNVTVYYALATTTTIDLGYINPPIVTEDDDISIVATLTPEIDASWWSYDEITQLIADLKAYVDYKTADESDALNLHVIQPISIRDDMQQNDVIESIDDSLTPVEGLIESEEQ